MNDESKSIRLAWSRLVENGTPHEDLEIARHVLPAFTVVFDEWVNRLAVTYLQDLCRHDSHTKLVVGQYGSGKTHFLLLLALRALEENYAVSFIKCREGVSLDQPTEFYREVVNNLLLPGEVRRGGVAGVMRRSLERWKKLDGENPDVPDALFALDGRLEELDEQPFAFGRVAATFLRCLDDSGKNRELMNAARMWLNGEHGALSAKDLQALRLKKVTKADEKRFGNDLRTALVRFLPQSGAHGLVLLVDEAENMLSAKGKALVRVVQAMRTHVDDSSTGSEALPCFTLFAAVQDIDDQIRKYQALDSRFRVAGKRFHEGADSAARIEMDQLGNPIDVLVKIGARLIPLGEQALAHKFDPDIQEANLRTTSRVVVIRKAEADARRLFVKTWCALLEEQKRDGERKFTEDEVNARTTGVVEEIRAVDSSNEGAFA